MKYIVADPGMQDGVVEGFDVTAFGSDNAKTVCMKTSMIIPDY